MEEKTKKKSIKGRIILLILLLGIAALAGWRVTRPGKGVETEPLSTVSLSRPLYSNIYLETSLVGTVMPGDVYYVMPKAAGEIKEIYVKQGDLVSEGDPICLIDNSKQIDAARISLDGAEVQVHTMEESVKLARTNLDRMSALYASGDVAAQTYEQTKNGYDQAVAGLDGARFQYEAAKLQYDTQVEFATVTSPVNGRVESTSMSVNGMASQASQVAVVSSLGGSKIEFSVTDRLLDALVVGGKLSAQRQGEVYSAHITSVSELPSQTSGLYPVEAAFDSALNLARGTSLKLSFVSEKAENVLAVETDSIFYDGGKTYVYTFTEDEGEAEGDTKATIADNNIGGTVHKVEVETGLSDTEMTEILSGVTESDLVIRSWTSQLYEGARVQALKLEG